MRKSHVGISFVLNNCVHMLRKHQCVVPAILLTLVIDDGIHTLNRGEHHRGRGHQATALTQGVVIVSKDDACDSIRQNYPKKRKTKLFFG